MPGPLIACLFLDPEGRWLTDVSLPTSWRIFAIGADHVLVLVTDELEVQYVRKFALTRGSRSAVEPEDPEHRRERA